ncbi:MAG: cytidylate kinase-like family protein [Myxococcales bacterium]|nr:cytidylate kinase-like family protein [Myxococcales bacterium]
MTSIEQLVDRQVRKWASETQQVHGPPPRWPVITVSRAYGSRGGELAARVADKLGFELWDRRIVEAIASSASLRRHVVESLDDKVPGRAVWLSERFERGYFSRDDYLSHLAAVIDAIARHGRAVILGRGAHMMIAPANALRVRVTAALEPRVAWIARHEGLSMEDARARALRIDAERRAFAEHHFGVELDDPAYFDLVLSTDVLSLERAVELVIDLFRQRFGDRSSVAA